MTCMRDTPESGRLFVPWPIEGHGMPLVGHGHPGRAAGSLHAGGGAGPGQAQRHPQPVVRLDADGARVDARAGAALCARPSMRSSVAATSTDRPDECTEAAQACLDSASRAGDLLIEAYTSQILQSRLASTSRLSTHLGCVLDGPPQKVPPSLDWPSAFNTCHLGVSWKQVAPSEGQYRWDVLDAQLAWCRRNGLDLRGRAADRVPPRCPPRLGLALGGRLRDD